MKFAVTQSPLPPLPLVRNAPAAATRSQQAKSQIENRKCAKKKRNKKKRQEEKATAKAMATKANCVIKTFSIARRDATTTTKKTTTQLCRAEIEQGERGREGKGGS